VTTAVASTAGRARPASSPRTPGRAVAAAATALVAWQALRLARALARDVVAHRRAAAVLGRAWTRIAIPESPHWLRVHARVGGRADADAPPVVLVHGYGVSGRYFVPLAARLAGTVRVLAPDLPGHGRSDPAPAPLSVPAMAGALAAWMHACGLRGAVLVGQSMGAQIATELAVREPGLVAGLVLVGPTVDPSARSATELMARAALTALAERPLLDVCVAWDYVRAGPRLIVREMRHMLAHRVEALLPSLTTLGRPVRVLRGAHDHIAPHAWTEAVAADAGAERTIVVPRGAHAAQYTAPELVAQAVLAVVGEVQDAARDAVEPAPTAAAALRV
jgi:pimeloyl-ACP methyl ester carboxylesterase